MRIKVFPSPLSGSIKAIPSKSDAHRLFICAALSDKETVIHLPSSSVDIDTTLDCLEKMGARIKKEGEYVTVTPSPFIEECVLNANESGSTLRFIVPVASAVCGKVTFEGSGRLPDRPITDLTNTLKENGVTFSAEKLPFTKTGRLHSGTFTLPGNVSSQYITGLLFALPLLEGDSEIILTTKLESSAYVDITLGALKKFGIEIKATERGYFVKGNQKYISPDRLSVDGDWSNAAFFLVSGAIKNGVSMTGLDRSSFQGDKRILNVLEKFGAQITKKDEISVAESKLFSNTVDISEIPDMLPALAVLASFAKGTTKFTGGARLRIKESDRLHSVTQLINSLGGKAEELDEGIKVEGVGLLGGEVDGFNDHRIVMAAAIGGSLSKKEVIINGAEAVNKSYPAFFKDFESLGGKYNVI
ncbi:MAG: 3-phosphoshikimate 1-carboxyvinyltransferase [Clostridia bacterium]|nr:3-phosphoshikimate 1-carboxyvinyltransferase [Clostridia bacterium]